MVKRKRTNNDLQNTTENISFSNKNSTKTRGEFRLFGMIMCSCSGTSHVTVETTRTTSGIEIVLHTSTKKNLILIKTDGSNDEPK
jgi:hypothetical protein